MTDFILPVAALLLGIVSLIQLKRGPVFVPANYEAVEAMIRLLDVKTGERAVDLGSGDGRIVMALARAGAEAHGYEHNIILVWWSRFKIKRAGLSGRAFIHWKNFWKADFSKFTIFTVFGIPYIMSPLQEKLSREAVSGSRAVSYTFKFPSIQATEKALGNYLYRF
jgi:16S rRNA A1518/A1519 N6-dimethyltransferase RsmA/KsgA/DIM1 with predicted DNA glycosylase/AP lyase activity